MNDPSVSVIQQSIQQLEKLCEVLAGEVPSNSGSTSLSRGARLSKETLLTISVLLPKLYAVREAHARPPQPASGCARCED